jgi:O-antigen/teichoic acid export membrane protein
VIGIIAKLRTVLPKGKFMRAMIVLAGGTALGQGLVLLTSPLLTRIYSPEDFGVVAVYGSILFIATGVTSLRYEITIPLPESDEAAANLLLLSLAIVLGMSLASILGVWLMGEQIIMWTNADALQPYLWLLPLGILGGGIYQVFNFWAVRKKAFVSIAGTKLNQSLGLVITQVGLGLLRIGPLGLLLGQIVGQAAGWTTLATRAWREDKTIFKTIKLTGVRQVAGRYRRFSILSSASVLLNNTSSNLPVLLLAAFFGPQVAGFFELSRRIINLPLTLIGQAVSQVYYGEAAELARTDLRGLKKLYINTAFRMLLIGSLPALALIIAGPLMFEFVFGSDWREAGVYAQILAISFVAKFAVSSISNLAVLERQGLALFWNMLFVILVSASLWGTHLLDLTILQMLLLLTLGTIIAYVLMFWINIYAINVRLREQL